MKDNKRIIEHARAALTLAYCPYSNFRVGAALETKQGEIFVGANIENASYGLSMCAERNAMYNAYCHGVKKEDIMTLCVIGETKEVISPCGACRQVMAELLPSDCVIILATTYGKEEETTLEELLPRYFKGEDLEK